MEMTYKYQTVSLSTEDTQVSGFVNKATIVIIASTTVNGVDYDATASMTLDFEYDETKTLTPYSDLTEEQVVGWVIDGLGTEEVDKLKATAKGKIETKINSIKTKELPWN
jgi:hypothetical protein